MLANVIESIRSLRGRLTPSVLAVVACGLLLLASSDLFIELQREADLRRAEVERDAGLVVALARRHLAQGEVSEFRDRLVELAQVIAPRRLDVFDRTTGATYRGQPEAPMVRHLGEDTAVSDVVTWRRSRAEADGEHYRVVAPVIGGGMLLAIVDLEKAVGDTWSDVLARAGPKLVALVVVATLVFAGLVVVLASRSQAMAQLAEAVRRAVGDSDARAAPSRRDGAVGELGDAVGAMIRLLADQADRARSLAMTDPLTGLANRASFNTCIEVAPRALAFDVAPRALILVDIDRFRQINEIFGFAAGDAVLVAMARRIEAICTECRFPPLPPTADVAAAAGRGRASFIARYGGDQFALCLWGHSAERDLRRIGEHIGAAMRRAVDHDGALIDATGSIGLVDLTGMAPEVTHPMRLAELAMVKAGSAGPGRMAFFSPDLDRARRERLIVEMELRKALALGELTVHYMPKWPLPDGRVDGVEALARWQHPRRGLLHPQAFIAVAEECGLIDDIDRFVLEQSSRQAALWAASGFDVSMAVNVSPGEFEREGYVASVLQTIRHNGLDPGLLEIEITESTAMSNPERAGRVMAELRERGVRLAIDDFGTGFSNLAHLTALPFDILKIDQSFIRALGDPDPAGARMVVETILNLARNLGVETVAEGIETVDQAVFLHLKGCDRGQGFLVGRAMPAEEIEARYLRLAEAPCPAHG